ncbi:hypothetical protein [uncultured Pluralibacter sp.]|uniref:hypothetical protein n=1 Tax=uncultured Pluralibacter sp. TaxID=1490864 RepID=UPI00260789F4|nr:hypothetical protein [uncultured Pluralibacter sp.]
MKVGLADAEQRHYGSGQGRQMWRGVSGIPLQPGALWPGWFCEMQNKRNVRKQFMPASVK